MEFEPPNHKCPPLVEMVPEWPIPPSLFELSKSDHSTTFSTPLPLVVITPVLLLVAIELLCMVNVPVPPDLVMVELFETCQSPLKKIFPVAELVRGVELVMVLP